MRVRHILGTDIHWNSREIRPIAEKAAHKALLIAPPTSQEYIQNKYTFRRDNHILLKKFIITVIEN